MDKKFKIVNGILIYDLDYLMNENLTENDLNNLFDNKSILYSFIVGMFRFIHLKKSDQDILRMIKIDNWYNRYSWSYKERQEYENMFTKALMNIYSYSKEFAKSKAQWYITIYGFKIK